jgi:hypothetical protein
MAILKQKLPFFCFKNKPATNVEASSMLHFSGRVSERGPRLHRPEEDDLRERVNMPQTTDRRMADFSASC